MARCVLGAEGREFESLRPDHHRHLKNIPVRCLSKMDGGKGDLAKGIEPEVSAKLDTSGSFAARLQPPKIQVLVGAAAYLTVKLTMDVWLVAPEVAVIVTAEVPAGVAVLV